MNVRKVLYILVFTVFLGKSDCFSQFYYGMQMDFGKNRIQYQDFNWTYFEFDRYRVYSYAGGSEIAKYVATSMKNQLPIMERRLDFQVDDKLQILVYNNQNDFKQSNLGLSAEDQTNVGGVTHIVGDKMSVYFNGSHADLDRQIRAALAELMIDQLMYGGRARDMVRNSTLLVLPEWYKKGLVSFLSEPWDTYKDIEVMDAIKNNRFSKLNRLEGKDAVLAGHAFWYYISYAFGETAIPNVLVATKIMRKVDEAFMTSQMGTNVANLMLEMTDAFNKRYYYEDTSRILPFGTNVLTKPKKSRHYYNLKVSPDGQKAIYASNEMGQFKVWMNTLGETRQKKLLKYGPKVQRMEDYNYPLLAWHPNGNIVAILYERKDQLVLQTIDISNGDKFRRNITGFEKINSFSFSSDGKRLAMSAVKKGKGQSDVFVFLMNSGGLEQMTNDIWDDNNPVFVKNNTGIVFESNRQSDTIRPADDAKFSYKLSRKNDLFYAGYPFKSQVMIRVTNTPEIHETQPQEYSKTEVAYLSEKNGIYNRFLARPDSSISFVDTIEHYRYFFKSEPISNYSKNIIEQNISVKYNKKAEIAYVKGEPQLLISDLEKSKNIPAYDLKETWLRSSANPTMFDPEKIVIAQPKRPEAPPIKVVKDTVKKEQGIDFNNYTLSGEKTKPKTESSAQTVSMSPAQATDSSAAKPSDLTEFKFPIQQNYYTAFYVDYVVTQLDNSYLGTTYQRFTGGSNPVYLNPGLNALLVVSMSDIFEDQRIKAGMRIAGTLDNEYLLSWENRKKLIDHKILVHRQSMLKVNEFYGQTAKVQTHDGGYSVKLPFSEVMATRLSLLYRNDRVVFASVGDLSLPMKNLFDNYAGAKLEYIFDNTRNRGLNLYNGVRLKIWGEYWRKIEKTRHDLITFGFDVRGYKKLHRDLIWCNRFAGGGSLGTDRLIFYLGGVDNWFNPSFDQTINVVHPETYQFQTLATNMRGFKQNIRNGNNFVVYNSEIRWPIFRYLFDRPLRSDFVNNFQVVFFGDIGMAWYGWNPLSEENILNKNVYHNNPITLTVFDQKNPLVGGYGFGFRSRLLGYFIRVDFGWGVDDMNVSKSRTYLSFTTDF